MPTYEIINNNNGLPKISYEESIKNKIKLKQDSINKRIENKILNAGYEAVKQATKEANKNLGLNRNEIKSIKESLNDYKNVFLLHFFKF